jgi:hypothetical protein
LYGAAIGAALLTFLGLIIKIRRLEAKRDTLIVQRDTERARVTAQKTEKKIRRASLEALRKEEEKIKEEGEKPASTFEGYAAFTRPNRDDR